MSAAELRQAADTLRERASVATPGPWTQGASGFMARVVYDQEQSIFSEAGRYEDAAYIATMHPSVGLALADWLDHYASVLDAQHPIAFADDAIALARAINGGVS